MQKILAISGDTNAGKDTLVNYATGLILQKVRSSSHPEGVIDQFKLGDDGELLVKQKKNRSYIELDLSRKDYDFVSWAFENIWPYTKTYSFADPLKRFIMEVFGVPYDHIYKGRKLQKTEFDKSSIEETETNQKLSVRDLMIYLAEKVCKRIDPYCFAKTCYLKVLTEQIPIVFITDMRFLTEFSSRPDNVKVLKLTRNGKKHELKNMKTDYCIDNENLNLKDTLIKFDEVLNDVGIFSEFA